jgi:hypothetical protein
MLQTRTALRFAAGLSANPDSAHAATQAALTKAYKDYKAKCPTCDMTYAGDVEALLVAYADGGKRNRVYYASTMMAPEGFPVAPLEKLLRARKEVLRLYDAVRDRGTGLLPTAAATANAALAKEHPDVAETFATHDCWYFVDDTAFIVALLSGFWLTEVNSSENFG